MRHNHDGNPVATLNPVKTRPLEREYRPKPHEDGLNPLEIPCAQVKSHSRVLAPGIEDKNPVCDVRSGLDAVKEKGRGRHYGLTPGAAHTLAAEHIPTAGTEIGSGTASVSSPASGVVAAPYRADSLTSSLRLGPAAWTAGAKTAPSIWTPIWN